MPKTYSLYAAKWHLSLANISQQASKASRRSSPLSFSLFLSLHREASFHLLSFSFFQTAAQWPIQKSVNLKKENQLRPLPHMAITSELTREFPTSLTYPKHTLAARRTLHASQQQSLISWPYNEWRRTQDARHLRSRREARLALKAEPGTGD